MINMADGNFAGGDGTENNPYLIEDAHDLNAIKGDPDAHYKLIDDIDLDIVPYNMERGWESVRVFNGVFDGDFYSISNLFSTNENGLFKNLNGATIKNLILLNVNTMESSLAMHTTNSSLIENCLATGMIKGSSNRIGGLIGEISSPNCRVQNCASYLNVEANGCISVGGLVGMSRGGDIKNCYSQAHISVISARQVGGLLGYSAGELKNCFSTTSITGVTRPQSLVGYNIGELLSVFWDKEKSGISISDNGVGLTTLEMQTKQTFVDAGWDKELTEDGDLVWLLDDGEYPRLWFEQEPHKLRYLIKSEDRVYTIA